MNTTTTQEHTMSPTDPRAISAREVARLNAAPCCEAAPHGPEAPCYDRTDASTWA